MPSFVYILLGSNQGNAIENLKTAASLLEEKYGNIIQYSSFYRTEAWGNTKQAAFLNQVLLLQTKFTPMECLAINLAIESSMGRIRKVKWEPRVIDIDILYFNNEIIETPQLTIPHPQIANRRFTLIPLAEIAPNLVHPQLGLNSVELLKSCPDKLEVEKMIIN
jgi:2-amino-4-hydroxy-6-hydroxymethyldihydropteridine diphosphokinase